MDYFTLGYENGCSDGRENKPRRPNKRMPKIAALFSNKVVTQYLKGYNAGYLVGCKARNMKSRAKWNRN